MSEQKHTPGPWATDDHETHWSVLSDEGQHIADVRQYTDGLNPLPEGEANAALVAAAPQLLDALTAPTWLVWSNEHAAWWGPKRCGYYWRVESAGRYTLAEALEICTLRGVERGDGINPPELIQPSPEWLAARSAAIAKAKGD